MLSILVTTFNRQPLLARAIGSIRRQTFTDYELVIIDDCSTDGTEQFIRGIQDPRIRYYRNEQNMFAQYGDRGAMRRFVHELAQGDYFVYLCDDDYWRRDDLLARQMELFKKHPTAGIVMGGHLSVFMTEGNRAHFHDGVFPREFMTSDELLEHFTGNPITANITAGARIYRRENFIRSGILEENPDIKVEAGFEILIGPAAYGDFVYINEPEVWVEVWPHNASFGGTQLSHFLDSVASIKAGFRKPIIDFPDRPMRAWQRRMIENIGTTYLGNADHIRLHGSLSYCTPEHMSRVVTEEDVKNALAGL